MLLFVLLSVSVAICIVVFFFSFSASIWCFFSSLYLINVHFRRCIQFQMGIKNASLSSFQNNGWKTKMPQFKRRKKNRNTIQSDFAQPVSNYVLQSWEKNDTGSQIWRTTEKYAVFNTIDEQRTRMNLCPTNLNTLRLLFRHFFLEKNFGFALWNNLH